MYIIILQEIQHLEGGDCMNLMVIVNRTDMSLFPTTPSQMMSKETKTHVENDLQIDNKDIFQKAVQKCCGKAFSVTANYLNMMNHV